MSCPVKRLDGCVGVCVGVVKLRRVGVFKSGLAAEEKLGVHGENGPWDLESCLGVWKEFRKKFGDVGVLVGVGGSPPG